jgi:hypothetical protein
MTSVTALVSYPYLPVGTGYKAVFFQVVGNPTIYEIDEEDPCIDYAFQMLWQAYLNQVPVTFTDSGVTALHGGILISGLRPAAIA